MFDAIRSLFAGGQTPPEEVARLFAEALTARAKLELEPVKSVRSNPPLIVLSLESIGEGDFVVSQPTAEAAQHLHKGRRYMLGFFDEESRLIGETTCLGRTQYEDDRNRMIYTYRFSLPTKLRRQEPNRRRERRIRLDVDPEVELSAFELKSPIYGVAVDLGRRGARIRCHNAMNKLRIGQDVYLKTTLPEPIGQFSEMVRVMNLQPCRGTPELLVGVSFHGAIPNFDALLKRDAAGTAYRHAG